MRVCAFPLALAATVVSLAAACPGAYDPWVGGRCLRITDSTQSSRHIREKCAVDGGELVSIHSAEENERIRQTITNDHKFVWIGVTCDNSQFAWMDGTPFDFSNIDDTCDGYTANVVMRQKDGVWMKVGATDLYRGICETLQPNNIACNDYDQVEDSLTCVSLRNNSATWKSAESQCQQEGAHLVSFHDPAANDYLAAMATQLGLYNGIHIGLHTNSSRHENAWSDGTNLTFTNFATGFPNDIFGHCVAMTTNSRRGEWVNSQCDASQLPYACARPAYDINHPLASDSCPDSPYYFNAGTIFSPSYPGSPNMTTCVYFLAVDKGKRVQLSFDDYNLNKCCDKIELFEGSLGGRRIDSITGDKPAYRVFYTSTSNVMVLALTTRDGRRVRGFRAIFETRH